MSNRQRLTLEQARDYVAQTLVAFRTGPANARSVARALVAAEADGLGSHGLSRLANYAAQAQIGKVDGFAVPQLDFVRPGLMRVDARHGFAYPAIDMVMDSLADAARQEGLAAASIYNSNHCGAMGLHVERLAREGFCALMFANAPAAMAPWGGQVALYGTNPIAFGAPVPGRDPVIVDMSLSKVARGNIMAAQQKSQPIPEGWALDADGAPTTDAAAALAGTMLPMGDAKGTALALMVEILATCMTGALLSKDASSFLDAKGAPTDAGQMILAFDPCAFSGGFYDGRIAALVAAIENQPGVRLPGARRMANRRRAETEGLLVDVAGS